MSNNTISIDGIEEVLNSLQTLEDIPRIENAIGKACALVEASAKQKAPKGGGDLRRSITSKVENLEGVVYTPLFYAPYVEYGTGLYAEDGKGRQEVPWVYVEGSSNEGGGKKKVYTPDEAEAVAAFLQSKGLDARVSYGMHPTPFMRPALYENRQKIIEILKGE